MSNTFKFGNGKWATGKGSVLAYNDENNNFKPLPFDFTRASSATRVNENGLIEVVGSDEPRIDYLNNTSGHLLLEPSRSNVVTYSEDLTTGWSYSFGGTGSLPVITSNDAVAPDGNTTADKVVLDMNGGTTGSDWSFIAAPYTSAVATFTMTCYLKGVNGGEEIFFDFDNGNSNLITLTTEWVRYDFVKTVNTTGTRYIRIGLRGSDTTDDTASFYMWGAQLEEGSYATSYIPTSGSSVTRNKDVCSQTPASSVINQDEGTLYVEFNVSTGDGIGGIVEIINPSSTNNRVLLWDSTSASSISLNAFFGAKSGSIVKSSVSLGTHKAALTYSSTATKFFLDGVKIGEQSSAAYTGLSKIDLENTSGTVNFQQKRIKDMKLYNTALTDAELIALTS